MKSLPPRTKPACSSRERIGELLMKKLFKGVCLLLLLAIFFLPAVGCIPGVNQQINGENGAENVNGEEEQEEE